MEEIKHKDVTGIVKGMTTNSNNSVDVILSNQTFSSQTTKPIFTIHNEEFDSELRLSKSKKLFDKIGTSCASTLF